jgi:hypothetical protein
VLKKLVEVVMDKMKGRLWEKRVYSTPGFGKRVKKTVEGLTLVVY